MKRTPVDAAAGDCGEHAEPTASAGGRTRSSITSHAPGTRGKAGIGVIREGGQHEADRIREFICGLSPNSQYLRFFATVAPPSSGLMRVLCGGTGADILLITDPSGAVLAHGMAADTPVPGGLASNIGLVVADRWQQQGLGTLLLSTLIGRASRRGVGSLVLDVLPANDRMLGIISRRWPDAPRQRTPDAIVIRPAITPWHAARGHAVPGLIRLACDRPASQSRGLHPQGRPAA